MTVQLKKKLIVVSQKYWKSLLFQEKLQPVTELVNQGIGLSLSNIRDLINLNQCQNLIPDKKVKLLPVKFLSYQVWFCKLCQPNQSLIVVSLDLSVKDGMRKPQSIDTIKSAAKEIRKSLNESTFNLKNKFCGADEPKNSWNDVQMPRELIYFFNTFLISLSHIYAIVKFWITICIAEMKKHHFISLLTTVYMKSAKAEKF